MQLPNDTLLQGGKYKIVRFLSSGGFGNTYEALDVNLDKRVAIKEFFVKDFCSRDKASAMVTISVTAKKPLIEHLKKKFVEEARAIARMEHDNIVRVHALFEENSTAYYVMEYVDGEPLSALLKRRGSLPENEAVAIILKVAGALDYMHRQNRFHLDVKPGNIMLRKDGKVILIDFGSSKQYAEVDGENTTTLAPCYTPGYAPSEQMNPKPTAFTAATDIYALGATLYKMLTGLTPPSAIDLVNGEETLSPLPDEMSRNARECVDKAMVPQRNKRMQSIADFVSTLQASEGTIIADAVVSESAEETLSVGNEAEELFKLAERYREGKGIEKDLPKAFELYKKAAELGYVIAQYNLGECYDYGNGVAQDYKHAFEWYEKAAMQGHADAQNILGDCYYWGEGVAQDYKQAVGWYEKAAAQGDADAQYKLGACYHSGDGVAEDDKEAVEWYEKAALQGNIDAQNSLGFCYYCGNGVAQDYKKAVEWYKKAATQGHADAQYWLGDCYYNGNGVAQDYKKAVEWYEKAATQGHADAQYWLGDCYYCGNGVAQDYKKAVEWYEKAAMQGHADAQYWLRCCLEKSLGIPQDEEAAKMWYEKAAKEGHTQAQKKLESKWWKFW